MYQCIRLSGIGYQDTSLSGSAPLADAGGSCYDKNS